MLNPRLHALNVPRIISRNTLASDVFVDLSNGPHGIRTHLDVVELSAHVSSLALDQNTVAVVAPPMGKSATCKLSALGQSFYFLGGV